MIIEKISDSHLHGKHMLRLVEYMVQVHGVNKPNIVPGAH